MTIDIAFGLFLCVALAAFSFFSPERAVLLVFLGGWIVLPVGHYPVDAAAAKFPYWITGTAVPSQMLLTKAWVAPAAAAVCAALMDTQRWLRARPSVWDLPMALWCAWPLAQGAVLGETRPDAAVASLYLAGSWGLPWLLGRLYFGHLQAQLLLLKGLALAALACLPFRLLESWAGSVAYGAVYETHPFRFDGQERYLGQRPLGFFEHGTQFGLWVALGALAALWLAWAGRHSRSAQPYRWVAGLLCLMTVAAQSAGSVLYVLLGAALLWACGRVRARTLVLAPLAAAVLMGAVYVSGVLPIMKIGKETAVGRTVVDAFRAVGRGSFTWRISQDQRSLSQATARPVLGSGSWDWWRARELRPWGLLMLVLGQFGLLGLMLMLAALLGPPLRLAWLQPPLDGWRSAGLPLLLATLLGMALLDMLLNSFIYFPAVLAAGALVGSEAAAGRQRARAPA